MSVRIAAMLILVPALTGCNVFRTKAPARAGSEPEFRGASAQNGGQPLTIVPPPPPKLLLAGQVEEPPLRRLANKAAEREKTLDAYYVRIRYRENVDGKDQPEEIILFKFRRAPLSVHCKWLGKEAHGREIVYVQGQHGDKIHVLTGQGDLFGAGRKMAFSPDSYLVRKNLRHPIQEASLGSVSVRFAALIDAIDRGQVNMGAAKYLGEQNRPEFAQPVEVVEQTIPPGVESALAKGGVRFYYFDPILNMPTLVVAFDHNRHQVEYYHFDRLQAPVALDDMDFDPAAIWHR